MKESCQSCPFYLHNQTHFKPPTDQQYRRSKVKKKDRDTECKKDRYIVQSMRGREGKGGAPPTDFLACFPSRTHLALMPKPANSPVRLMESSRRRNSHPHHQHNQIVKFNNRGGHASKSPVLWAKTKSMESEVDEPTSPKVTCAGQIKVRSKSNCKNWQSVMGEIERLHNNRKHKKKKPTWIEALGLKKDVTQFLSCLRGMKLDLRCFGSFHASVISSDDDNDDEEKEYHNHEQQHREMANKECADEDGSCSSKAVFSKWFMVLEENQDHISIKDDQYNERGDVETVPCAPPPNALLLMRCRSAPAKTWLEEKQKEEEEEEAKNAKLALEEKHNKENLILKYYSPDFYMVSSDIAKETWVVGGARDSMSRSLSSKR